MHPARFDPVRFAEALNEARAAIDGSGPASLTANMGPPGVLPPQEDPVPALGSTLVCLDRVGSTQDAARLLLKHGAPHGTIVLAEEQVGGRGRRGRPWESPPGAGVWATIVLRRTVPATDAPWLMLAGAVAACEAARRLGVPGSEIKWPNDLVVGERKFGGILGELIADGPRSHAALLGIGLNVDLDPARLGARVDRPATSLRAEGLRATAGREEVLALLLSRMEGALAQVSDGASAVLLERWRALSPSSRDRRVIVEDAAGVVLQGTTQGIGPDGSLLVRTEDGIAQWVRFGGTLRFVTGIREGADAPRH